MLKPKSFGKALVPPSLLSNPSPGSIQSSRLALHVNDDDSRCYVFIASGCRVYQIELSLDESMVSEGKGSLLLPVHAQVLNSSVVNRCPHRSEIQSIVLAEGDGSDALVLGTVDSYGHLIVSRIDKDAAGAHKVTYSVLPQDSGVGEGGWAGVCFSPADRSAVAVARSLCKSVDVYDQDILIKRLHTLYYPASLCFLQRPHFAGSSALAVAEGSLISIWDLRSFENGGCIHRIQSSVGDHIYTVCTSPAGNIAVGGSDRTVTIYDSRRWSAVSRWVNCCKYEISSCCFSSIDPAYIYVQNVDYEVLCGQWKECKKEFSFRGDSNWLGFGKCSNKDVLAGWCDSGSIFVADIKMQKQKGHSQ